MSNTKLWDDLKRVPPDQLKQFSRSGGFKGTAIKPMWSFRRMTEMFGPCGTGWGINDPEFQTVSAGDEILVFCTVSVWHGERSQYVFGVGGDKVRVVESRGPRNDDEAFKKAYTDAVTNALKLIGVGADIHMGLWDGNKYVDEAPEKPPMPSVQGTQGASKAGNRATYGKLVQAIRNAPTLKALTDWYAANVKEIDALPSDWIEDLRVEYSDRMAELKRALAA